MNLIVLAAWGGGGEEKWEKERRKEEKENVSLEDLTGSRVLNPNIQNVHNTI